MENVPRLCGFHIYGAVDLVETGKVEGTKSGGGAGRSDLAVGRVEAVEGDDFAGLNAKDGRDAGGRRTL